MVQKIVSTVTKAVVYRTGAYVTRHAKIHLQRGRNRLCFESLPKTMVGETIQIFTDAGVSCNQVKYEENYLLNSKQHAQDKSDVIRELNVRRTELEDAIKTIDVVYKTLCNEHLFDKSSNFSVDQLKEYMDYTYQKQTELLKERRNLVSEVDKTIQEIREWDKNNRDREVKEKLLSGAVLLDMEAEQEGEYDIEIMAYDTNVSWKPVYDIRVDSLMLPMSVILKGKITQQTGENWENIRLVVSTGNLKQSNNQPELKPWNLRILPDYSMGPLTPPPVPLHYVDSGAETTVLHSAALLDAPTEWPLKRNEVAENQTSIEYRLAGHYSLHSDDDGSIFEIIRNSIEAEYCYYITPKAECGAYLMAIVKNWRSMDWLECDANIFLENRYVGATHVSSSVMDDLFKISLGRDRFITVSRNRVKHSASQKLLGNLQCMNFEYQLKIRNEKEVMVPVIVTDQIPISDNDKITVDILNISGAEYEPGNGRVTWRTSLRPGEKLELTLGFNVNWPKGTRINI